MQIFVLGGLTLIVCAVGWRYLRPAPSRVEGFTAAPSTLAEYRNHLNGVTGADVQWADCPCCGCPTFDAASPLPDCGVCDWLHDPSATPQAIERARKNFAVHGTADPLQYTEEWFGPPPGAREIASRRAIVAASDAARAGTMELPDAWSTILEQLAVVDEEAGKRIDALERRFAED
ncbi:MAG TPA: hypothetical protein VF584_17245 [Longimicrobium sp.]|jgi:hypothetical protein